MHARHGERPGVDGLGYLNHRGVGKSKARSPSLGRGVSHWGNAIYASIVRFLFYLLDTSVSARPKCNSAHKAGKGDAAMNGVTFEAHAAAIREEVCSICACYQPDEHYRRICVHESEGSCVVFRHLPETIALVARFRGSDIASYENVYQIHACTKCHLADSEGLCTMRDRTKPVPEWCVADAYLPQIVGAIERDLEVETPEGSP